MREIYIKSKAGLLQIGRRGENLATRVHLSEVPAEGQAVTVFVLRNGDTASYPASEVEVTDTEIVWTVTSVDTGKNGRGKVQYRFSDATTGEVIKTEIYYFIVGLALDTEVGPAPDPYESWIDSLTELAGETQVNARMARESASEAASFAGDAAESASEAERYKNESEKSASEAASSAVDAAIYAGESELYAHEAAESAANAEQSAARAGWVHFWIDQETGHAYAAMTQNVADKCSFSINEETGNTEVTFYG